MPGPDDTDQGEAPTRARMTGGTITRTDGNGRTVTVIRADVDPSNGVVRVIERVLRPEQS